MNAQKTTNTEKWRPTLGMVLGAVLAIVLSLPIAALWVFRLYDSQLVRETERELIAQGAIINSTMRHEIQKQIASGAQDFSFGAKLPAGQLPDVAQRYRPLLPALDLTQETILPRRPEGLGPGKAETARYRDVGAALQPVLQQAQQTTLAGYRLLDPSGNVIAGGGEIGLSLAHVQEVKTALGGRYKSVLRKRVSKYAPPLRSISRSTAIRIFVAMPVVYQGRVAGVIYLSRTPNNILKELYRNRWLVFKFALFILLMTAAIGYILTRTIKGPVNDLNSRSKRIARGDRSAIGPLRKNGSRELYDLSHAIQDMAKKLFDRADYISTFATHVSHELKSPLTSIHGAAELLRDAHKDMSPEERERFCNNILADTTRLTLLLERLRDLAAADKPPAAGRTPVSRLIAKMNAAFPQLSISVSGDTGASLAMSLENATIVFSNLLDNARRHGASNVSIDITPDGGKLILSVSDNGTGISKQNEDKIFDLFFTTGRDSGGTGMGLGIVQSMLRSHNGTIAYRPGGPGACFVISLPLV